MALSAAVIKQVSNQIYRKFPEVKGNHPHVQKQRSTGGKKADIYLLKYEASVSGANGQKIRRTVRVTVDENGKILRTSTSR
jgi:hypothetical protein